MLLSMSNTYTYDERVIVIPTTPIPYLHPFVTVQKLAEFYNNPCLRNIFSTPIRSLLPSFTCSLYDIPLKVNFNTKILCEVVRMH